MSDLVERMARALFDREWSNSTVGVRDEVWVDQAQHDYFIESAKAALDASGLIEERDGLREALKKARTALHQHYVDWDGEPEDAVPLQLARAECDAALSRASLDHSVDLA